MVRKYTIALIFTVSLSLPCLAATLIECNWDNGTGTGATAVTNNGQWSDPGGTTFYEVVSGVADAPGGRNALLVKDVTGSQHMHLGTSLGNPTDLYVRLWFRGVAWPTSIHFLRIYSDNTSTDAGVCLVRPMSSDGHHSLNVPDSYSDGTVYLFYPDHVVGATQPDLNTWYRMEFHFTGGGTSSGTMEVRIDGLDVTACFERYSGSTQTLAVSNGSLTLSALNYFRMTAYDSASVGDCFYIAGLKATDGPDWIGGDDEEPASTPTITGCVQSGGVTR